MVTSRYAAIPSVLSGQAVHPAPHIELSVPRHGVRCNLCGSPYFKPFCPENGKGLVQCTICDLIYVGVQPDSDALYSLYDEHYFHNDDSGDVGYTNYVIDEANIRRTSARRLAHLERFTKPGRLLDVGCATGFFLSEAAARGWQVQGFDVSGFAVQYAREKYGLDVQQGSLLELDYPEDHYDLITAWDVIEHVPDPFGYIKHIAKLLHSGGMVALATPDIDSIPAHLTGERWVGYKLAEEHIYYFSKRTLCKMLDSIGFDIVDVHHVGKYVTTRLFLDRLGVYSPFLSQVGKGVASLFQLSRRSWYVNPFDIIAVTARKR